MKKLLSLLVMAVMVFAIAAAVPNLNVTFAASHVIQNNGLGGIYIDIDSAPYSTTFKNDDAYGKMGCSWFASARVNQLTGKGSVVWNGCGWYNTQGVNLGFKKYGSGEAFRANSVICYGPTDGTTNPAHVRILEKIEGNYAYISEGGTINATASNGYCRIAKVTLSSLKNNIKGSKKTYKYLGYIYYGDYVKSTTPTGSVMATGAGKTIPEGDYWIASELDQRYFVDIPGDKAITKDNAGANAQMWTWGDQMPTQYDVFHFDYLDNGFYRITQKGSDMSLDVSGCSAERGANVQMWTSNESNAQQWSVEYQSGRGYRLRARCSGFYLDVSGAAVANKTNVQIWSGNDSQAQRFALIPYGESAAIPDGTYKIQYDYNKDYYLTAKGDSSEYVNTTNVQITAQSADEYEFKYVGEGYYSIIEKKSGLSLDLNNSASAGYLADFTNIQLYEYKGSRNQLWFVQKSSSGTYFIYNKLSGFLIDVKGGQPSEGGDVAQYHYNGSGSQQWNLIRSSLAGDADDNMTVDVSDALLIQQYIAGWDVKIDLLNSNVDGDWLVTVSDVRLIQQAIAGWDVSLDCKAPLDLSDLPDMTAHI